VSVVVSAVVPVRVMIDAPAVEFTFSFTRGNIVPALAVFNIHRLKVTVEPAVITPAAFGTPAWVSKALMMYSPVATLFRFADWIARIAASGFAVFN